MKKLFFLGILIMFLMSCVIQESAYIELINSTSEKVFEVEISWNTFDGEIYSLKFNEILPGEKEEFPAYLGEGASFPIITDDRLSLFKISYKYKENEISYNPTLLDFTEYPGMVLLSGRKKVVELFEDRIEIKK